MSVQGGEAAASTAPTDALTAGPSPTTTESSQGTAQAPTAVPVLSMAARVTIKPADFSEATASGWFAILEAQFQLAHVTIDTTRFYHTLAALPAQLVSRLQPEVLSGQSYVALKATILSLVERSKPELFESLMTPEILTGRPSVCLGNLQRTALKIGVGEDFVRHRFLQALPPTISPVLASQNTLTLSQIGTLADELVALTLGKGESCAAVYPRVATGTAPRRQMEHSPRPSRNHPEDHRSHISVRPFHENQRPRICRAHIYYGAEARSCRAWCKWPEKSRCTIQPNSRPSSPHPVQSNHQDTQ